MRHCFNKKCVILKLVPGNGQVCHFEVFFSGYIEHGGEDWVSSGRENDRSSGQRGKLSDTSKRDNYIL